MMKPSAIGQSLRILALMTLVMTASATAAHAQGFVSPLIGYNFGGDSGCPEIDDCDDKNLNIGVAVGSLGSVFGVELEFAYAKDFFGESPFVSSSVLSLMGNVMLAPKFGPVQPYGVVGLGLIKTNVEFTAASFLESDNNHFGWDLGGGLIIFFTDHVGIRGDIRYFHALQDFSILGFALDETKLDFGRAAGALVFKF